MFARVEYRVGLQANKDEVTECSANPMFTLLSCLVNGIVVVKLLAFKVKRMFMIFCMKIQFALIANTRPSETFNTSLPLYLK